MRSRLLLAIETQQLRPGDMLPSERVLGEQFGVSRVSVREAIIGLEAVGLLQVHHGRGCFVSESISDLVTQPFAVWLRLYRDRVIEILKVRAALDGLAAAEAARSHSTEALSRIAEAERMFSSSAAEQPTDTSRLMYLDQQFHHSVPENADLPMVSALLQDLNSNVANPHRLTMSVPGRPEQAAQQHQAIVQAIQAGNPDAARSAAISHVESLVDLVLSY